MNPGISALSFVLLQGVFRRAGGLIYVFLLLSCGIRLLMFQPCLDQILICLIRSLIYYTHIHDLNQILNKIVFNFFKIITLSDQSNDFDQYINWHYIHHIHHQTYRLFYFMQYCSVVKSFKLVQFCNDIFFYHILLFYACSNYE